eukprot:TRINITY_DN103288_c0_g1_i1.p1 TRINITY_DN103288_c0_g1~~TRINITY_DN103288_c0_g1_i1.p1  ORF type:complete len:470 (-),score=100.54 TRINITY_DN103288_c0_g1_i1:73-1482(-)
MTKGQSSPAQLFLLSICCSVTCLSYAALSDLDDEQRPVGAAAASTQPAAPPPLTARKQAIQAQLRDLLQQVKTQSDSAGIRDVDPFAAADAPVQTNATGRLDLGAEELALAKQCVDRRKDEAFLDAHLHALSGYDGIDGAMFRRISKPLYEELAGTMARSPGFFFLELGSGVGAFSRLLLRAFPNAVGIGVEQDAQAVAISNLVLEKDVKAKRFLSLPGNITQLRDLPGFRKLLGEVDYIFIPGSLCHLPALQDVTAAMKQSLDMLKPGGHVLGGSVPESTSMQGSCTIAVPKDYWYVQSLCGCYDLEHVTPLSDLLDDGGQHYTECQYMTHVRKSISESGDRAAQCASCRLSAQLTGSGSFLWLPGYGGVGDMCRVDYLLRRPFTGARCLLVTAASVCTLLVCVLVAGSMINWYLDDNPDVLEQVRRYRELAERVSGDAASRMRHMRDTVQSTVTDTVRKLRPQLSSS